MRQIQPRVCLREFKDLHFERSFEKDPSKRKSRPALSSRAEFGHWEGDTVELVRDQSYFVTMVERSTRFLLVAEVPNKKAENRPKRYFIDVSARSSGREIDYA